MDIPDIVILPFAIVFCILWIVFSLLIILKPLEWIEFQNKRSRKYGFEMRVIDQERYISVNKRAGILLLVFGVVLFAIIAFGLIKI